MTLRLMNSAEIRAAYAEFLVPYFPEEERRPLSMIEAAIAHGAYECLGYYTADTLLAIAFLAALPGADSRAYLLDYFAVHEDSRGRGIGSACLRAVTAHLPAHVLCIAETEAPDTAADAAERAARERRIRFYRENGFADSGVRARTFGVRYLLLTPPCRETADEIRAAYAALYRSLLPEALYRTQIHID